MVKIDFPVCKTSDLTEDRQGHLYEGRADLLELVGAHQVAASLSLLIDQRLLHWVPPG